MAGRVRRPADRDQLLKDLTAEKEPFGSMAAAMVFAAALGYARGQREEFSKTSEEIPWEVFVNAGAEPLIDMLAAATTDDKDILASDRDEDRVRIFEEYAAGGLELIAERLDSDHRTPLDALIDLTLEFEKKEDTGGEIDLEAIAADLSA